MKKIQSLFGNALAACADAGSGLMIATILNFAFSHYHENPLIYVAAVFFALLPDFDVLLKTVLVTRSGHHRTILHQPFWFGMVGGLWLILGRVFHWPLIWPLMFVLGALAHLVHDSLGDENYPGIQWMSPFSMKKISFFCRRAWQGERRFIVVSASNADGMERGKWLQTFYLKPTREVLLEVEWFVLWMLIAVARWL